MVSLIALGLEGLSIVVAQPECRVRFAIDVGVVVLAQPECRVGFAIDVGVVTVNVAGHVWIGRAYKDSPLLMPI